MNTIYLVGHGDGGVLATTLDRAGFFVLQADQAHAALAMLIAVRADGFIIDVGDAEVGGERLIERLQKARPWRDIPIVVTGARPAQLASLARREWMGAVVPAGEHGPDAALAAVRRLVPRERKRMVEDLLGQQAQARSAVRR